MKPLTQKQRFIELRAQGLSFAKIAEEVKISKQTALNWSKELNLEVHNHKALVLDELYTQHKISTISRIEAFGGLLNRLRDEITKRDFSDIPTEKLVDLYTKLSTTLQKSLPPLSSKSESMIADMNFLTTKTELLE